PPRRRYRYCWKYHRVSYFLLQGSLQVISEVRADGAGTTFRNRMRQGWRIRAYRDVFTACFGRLSPPQRLAPNPIIKRPDNWQSCPDPPLPEAPRAQPPPSRSPESGPPHRSQSSTPAPTPQSTDRKSTRLNSSQVKN